MNISRILRELDWVLLLSVLMVAFFGIVTMKSFSATELTPDYFFNRQLMWLGVSIVVFIVAFLIDWSFLKTHSVFLLILYLVILGALTFLIVSGSYTRGAASWYRVRSVHIEPVELMKLALILILAKYFSKRHVEIARFIHLFISGLYVGVPAALVMLQPDFGSAMILGFLWIGLALVGGIRLRQVLLLIFLGTLAFLILWTMVLLPYQKTRILAFISPDNDIRGSGYHALQSMIAVGSGGVFGKGVGFGTQSRLEFLPEHETDFIFAAFAEEWGFVGVLILLFFFGMVLWRILRAGIYAESNFEKLYATGLGIVIFSQAMIHIGMNVGMLPITGLGMPFLSYCGSSLVSLFCALGILQSFSFRKKGIIVGAEDRYREGLVGA